MTTVDRLEITIGFTVTDRGNNYHPARDGYYEGARQVETVLVLENPPTYTPEQWGEAVFKVTNAPIEVVRNDPGATALLTVTVETEKTTGFPLFLRSLSIGDTVTVNGVAVECITRGFRRLERVPQRPQVDPSFVDRYTMGAPDGVDPSRLLGVRCRHGLIRKCPTPETCKLVWFFQGDLYMFAGQPHRLVALPETDPLQAKIAVALTADGGAFQGKLVPLGALRRAEHYEV